VASVWTGQPGSAEPCPSTCRHCPVIPSSPFIPLSPDRSPHPGPSAPHPEREQNRCTVVCRAPVVFARSPALSHSHSRFSAFSIPLQWVQPKRFGRGRGNGRGSGFSRVV
jgi:hypothetical protein